MLRPRTGNSWVAVETRCGEAEGHVLLAIDLATGRRREVDDPRQATATPVSDTHMLLRTPTDAWLLRLDGEDPPRHLATGVAAAAASGDGRWVYLYIETESDPDAPADGVYAIAVE